MKKQDSILPVIGIGLLTGLSVAAPMAGPGGIFVALIAASILITLAFHYGFQGLNQPQQHHHYHYQQQPQDRPYTEGHEKAALLPNGAQYRERIVRKYDS